MADSQRVNLSRRASETSYDPPGGEAPPVPGTQVPGPTDLQKIGVGVIPPIQGGKSGITGHEASFRSPRPEWNPYKGTIGMVWDMAMDPVYFMSGEEQNAAERVASLAWASFVGVATAGWSGSKHLQLTEKDKGILWDAARAFGTMAGFQLALLGPQKFAAVLNVPKHLRWVVSAGIYGTAQPADSVAQKFLQIVETTAMFGAFHFGTMGLGAALGKIPGAGELAMKYPKLAGFTVAGTPFAAFETGLAVTEGAPPKEALARGVGAGLGAGLFGLRGAKGTRDTIRDAETIHADRAKELGMTPEQYSSEFNIPARPSPLTPHRIDDYTGGRGAKLGEQAARFAPIAEDITTGIKKEQVGGLGDLLRMRQQQLEPGPMPSIREPLALPAGARTAAADLAQAQFVPYAGEGEPMAPSGGDRLDPLQYASAKARAKKGAGVKAAPTTVIRDREDVTSRDTIALGSAGETERALANEIVREVVEELGSEVTAEEVLSTTEKRLIEHYINAGADIQTAVERTKLSIRGPDTDIQRQVNERVAKDFRMTKVPSPSMEGIAEGTKEIAREAERARNDVEAVDVKGKERVLSPVDNEAEARFMVEIENIEKELADIPGTTSKSPSHKKFQKMKKDARARLRVAKKALLSTREGRVSVIAAREGYDTHIQPTVRSLMVSESRPELDVHQKVIVDMLESARNLEELNLIRESLGLAPVDAVTFEALESSFEEIVRPEKRAPGTIEETLTEESKKYQEMEDVAPEEYEGIDYEELGSEVKKARAKMPKEKRTVALSTKVKAALTKKYNKRIKGRKTNDAKEYSRRVKSWTQKKRGATSKEEAHWLALETMFGSEIRTEARASALNKYRHERSRRRLAIEKEEALKAVAEEKARQRELEKTTEDLEDVGAVQPGEGPSRVELQRIRERKVEQERAEKKKQQAAKNEAEEVFGPQINDMLERVPIEEHQSKLKEMVEMANSAGIESKHILKMYADRLVGGEKGSPEVTGLEVRTQGLKARALEEDVSPEQLKERTRKKLDLSDVSDAKGKAQRGEVWFDGQHNWLLLFPTRYGVTRGKKGKTTETWRAEPLRYDTAGDDALWLAVRLKGEGPDPTLISSIKRGSKGVKAIELGDNWENLGRPEPATLERMVENVHPDVALELHAQQSKIVQPGAGEGEVGEAKVKIWPRKDKSVPGRKAQIQSSTKDIRAQNAELRRMLRLAKDLKEYNSIRASRGLPAVEKMKKGNYFSEADKEILEEVMSPVPFEAEDLKTLLDFGPEVPVARSDFGPEAQQAKIDEGRVVYPDVESTRRGSVNESILRKRAIESAENREEAQKKRTAITEDDILLENMPDQELAKDLDLPEPFREDIPLDVQPTEGELQAYWENMSPPQRVKFVDMLQSTFAEAAREQTGITMEEARKRTLERIFKGERLPPGPEAYFRSKC